MQTRALLAALAAIALTATGCGGSSAGTPVVASSPGAMPECPTAPYVPRQTSGDTEREALPPPARDDVSGDRFAQRFALDNGALSVSPPGADDTAAYSGDDAVCEVLASAYDNNGPVGRQSVDTLAVGLARVTVADKLLGSGFLGARQTFGTTDGVPDVNPKRPAPTPYRDRLAWVVVLAPAISSSCPGMMAGGPSPSDFSEPGHHGYEVFLIDATTGGDALLYTERRNGICPGTKPDGPRVDVPLTSLSLPWRLESEEADRASAQISFAISECDGYSSVILADEDTDPAVVRVIVERPYGPLCSDEKRITEKMRAARVGTALPKRIEHAPSGPYVE